MSKHATTHDIGEGKRVINFSITHHSQSLICAISRRAETFAIEQKWQKGLAAEAFAMKFPLVGQLAADWKNLPQRDTEWPDIRLDAVLSFVLVQRFWRQPPNRQFDLWKMKKPIAPVQWGDLSKKVLKLLFSKDIPRLFGKDTKFAVLHHESAPAHKAAATVQWLESHGYSFIFEQDWCVNSPDLSPMNYSINRIFEQGLWKRKAQDINRLKRAMRQELSRISKEFCVK